MVTRGDVRELPSQKSMAGVNMELTAGGVRIALAYRGEWANHALWDRSDYGD